MEIKYSEESAKKLTRLLKGNRKSAESIIKTIESYAEDPSMNYDVKILKGTLGDFKRLRIRDYRIIFEDDGTTMLIYEIKHRKEAYR
ncbi:MAG: type II toxin-antitoxin system RelE/ParE family toxin [Nitrospirae bacterium]|nr:type II toxin-antitoxin system RelE/ParE family toxin [Nitrospirota bacterium]